MSDALRRSHELTRRAIFGVCLLLVAPEALLAQAGGAGGSGAGSAGTGATGPGAAATAGAQGTGQTSPATGQPAQGQQSGQTAAQQYAAGATLGPDPRKPPTSKPGALTMAQVVAAAEAHNPTLLAAQVNLRAVRAQEIQAGVRANPYFTFVGTNVTLPATGAQNPYSYAFQFSRLFELGEKRRWRLDDARATTAQTSSQLEDTIRQTKLQVKTAFTHMLIAKEAVELSATSLKDFRHEVEISLDRYKAGDLGKLDYERLDLQLGSFEADQSNNMVALQQASAQMQTLMGIETPLTSFDIAGDVVPPALGLSQDELLKQALTSRPDYAAARSAVLAAEANARLQRANGTTDPTLEAEYDYSGTYNTAGFSVNIPLRLFDRNQGNKQTARFQADASALTASATRNQVISDVQQAYVGYSESKRLSDRFGDHYLDESSDVLSIAQYAFEHGGIALIDYLDSLRDARTATSNALSAYQNTWLALHQLSAASAAELTP